MLIYPDSVQYKINRYERAKLILILLAAIFALTGVVQLVIASVNFKKQTDIIIDCTTATGKCYNDRTFHNALDIQATLYVSVNTCQSQGITQYEELEECTLNLFHQHYGDLNVGKTN